MKIGIIGKGAASLYAIMMSKAASDIVFKIMRTK